MKQLDKRSVWLFFAIFLFHALFFGIIISLWSLSWLGSLFVEDDYFQLERFLLWVSLLMVVFLTIAFVWAKLTYYFFRYELTDLGFRKESGVIWKRYVTIPYARIQNVDIHRGILARLLGLSDLQIQTAGASALMTKWGASGISAEGRLPGISKADAEVLRDELVRRAGGISSQGL